MPPRPMLALVTGAPGFVGSHLVRELLGRGDRVRCLVRRAGVPEPRSPGSTSRLVEGDVTRPETLARAVAGVDEVYHLAARLTAMRERDMFETNALGHAAAARGGLRLAGPRPLRPLLEPRGRPGPCGADGRPVVESTPPNPVTWYGRSKALAERAVGVFARGGHADHDHPPPGRLRTPGPRAALGLPGRREGDPPPARPRAEVLLVDLRTRPRRCARRPRSPPARPSGGRTSRGTPTPPHGGVPRRRGAGARAPGRLAPAARVDDRAPRDAPRTSSRRRRAARACSLATRCTNCGRRRGSARARRPRATPAGARRRRSRRASPRPRDGTASRAGSDAPASPPSPDRAA